MCKAREVMGGVGTGGETARVMSMSISSYNYTFNLEHLTNLSKFEQNNLPRGIGWGLQ